MTDTAPNSTVTDTARKTPSYVAYKVRDAGEKSYWDRIGVAFEPKDRAGFDLVPDCVPFDRRVSLRRPSEKPPEKEAA